MQCPPYHSVPTYVNIMSDRLDAIIFGATGFTGQHAVATLHSEAKKRPGFKWGIAGRSEIKLKQVINELQEQTGDDLSTIEIIIANAANEESLIQMTGRVKVIINTVGPYRFHGEAVFKACLKTNTNQVDVSGEQPFMERMQLQYDQEAREKQIYLISACGYGSIPNEMGIQFLESKFNGVINSVETFMETNVESNMKGPRLNYGTWESLMYGLDEKDELKKIREQLFSKMLPKFQPKLTKKYMPHRNNLVGKKWCVPYPGCDQTVVTRSQRFMFENSNKRPIQKEAYFVIGSFWALILLSIFSLVFRLLARFSFGRRLLLDYPDFFSYGLFSKTPPSRDITKATTFKTLIVAQGWDSSEKLAEPTDEYKIPPSKKLAAVVEGTDLGYGFTTACLIQAALTILDENDKMPSTGGVLTPGAAFAKTNLINKIQQTGVGFFKLFNPTDCNV